MAFHVACPITCLKICYCSLGFRSLLGTEEGKNGFLEEVERMEGFLKDPWKRRGSDGGVVQVKVPKVVVVDLPPTPGGGRGLNEVVKCQPREKQLGVSEVVPGRVEDGGGGGLDELALANASAQTKRLALQKKAAATSERVEDLARRFEAGDVAGEVIDFAGEEQGQLNAKIMCRLCLSGENDGTEISRKMLPCKTCGKKYHRSCLKSWSQNRELFHWSSWSCPSCRICEVCRRTGDPNKFMFCRRCDAAYHCYCQQPPHKNVSSGPYLCPNHTRCHSCDSSVPGNGLSVRWFLGYTCCDACGRLFVKGNYCPVCLKVYRDSESTPMVCCDSCQRWVHCQCDGISDAKYAEFQVDGNLEYACPTCRGECCQIRNPEEAVVELWRRRSEEDKDLIASLREAAGLPIQEEIFSISPFSDDEDNGSLMSKNEYGRSIKLSLKGSVEKSPKKNEHGKKSWKKKSGKRKVHQSPVTRKIEAPQDSEGHTALPSSAYSARNMDEELPSFQTRELPDLPASVSGSLNEKLHSTNQFENDEVAENIGVRTSRMVRVKSSTVHGGEFGPDGRSHMDISKSAKGPKPKLVIHLGSRNKNSTDSPKSSGSGSHKEPDMSNGSEDVGHVVDKGAHAIPSKFEGKGDIVDRTDQFKVSKSKIKIRQSNPDVTKSPMFGSVSTPGGQSLLGRSVGDQSPAETEVPASKLSSLEYAEGHPNVSAISDDVNSNNPAAPNSVSKDSRPLLKLKFKKPRQKNLVSWLNPKDDEMSLPKGQRSKRKRPLHLQEKASTQGVGDSAMDEIMDANWILQKLGKDAVGKRVEIHQPIDNSWHRGTVVEVLEGTAGISVALDDGKSKNLELGKQGVRFVSQKQRH